MSGESDVERALCIVTDWWQELRMLKQSGAKLEPGLSREELAVATDIVGATFPPDLADFLRTALPVGELFPNWREPAAQAIADALAWPFRGIAFDIEQNSFWWPAWGARPPSLEDALEIARRNIASHRLPTTFLGISLAIATTADTLHHLAFEHTPVHVATPPSA
jgi:hypothetical protein